MVLFISYKQRNMFVIGVLSPIGFKVSLLTTLFAVCVDRIQGGNVWIFERTLASKKYSVCVLEKASGQPLTYVSIRQIGGPVKHF